ncbi:MAG: inositol monophosphatase, partial [Bacteroidetes bacterium]|nr:inositol monophosphatase [Bacteroidota bacterium]
MNLENIYIKAQQIVHETGQYIKNEGLHFDRTIIETKSLNQLVSYVDKTAEEKLISGLSVLIKNASFYTEEATTERTTGEWTWVIDPLDGTTNFIHGLNVYSVSVGLMHEGKSVMGLVYDITRDEMFGAHKFAGAFLNNKPIKISSVSSLSDALLATGFPYYNFEKMPQYIEVLKDLMKNTHGLRRMGSAAIDLVYTACGRFDGFFEYALSPWDVAGGAFIVEEAGGLVTDFKGGDDYIFGNS